MLFITRYFVKDKRLMPWVKFIWHLEAQDANVHYKLLPTDCIDIILNLSSDMFYEVDSHRISSASFHVNGLRSRHSYIHQTGNIRIFGISFYPFGLYPFVNKSLAGIHNKIVDLYELSNPLAQDLKSVIFNGASDENIICDIEKVLCFSLQISEGYANKAKLIQSYLESGNETTIQSFCEKHAIHSKTFLRNVLHYTGYTPKVLRSIKRFQKAGNQLVHQKPERLSHIAYDNNFSDQAHSIREFRKFSGATPRTFQQEKLTVKENTKYTYR